VLYTDGLVERRNSSMDARMAQLAEVLAAETDSAAATAVDHLVARMLPEGPPSDDVALIAVKRSTDRTLHIRLPAVSTNLAPIRALMRRWLAGFGAPDADIHDIVLAVGELASNACTHASPMATGTVTIDAELADGVVRVTVSDQGRWRPPLDRGGGRGLKIVHALVDSLVIDSGDEGTRAHIVRTLAPSSKETGANDER